MTDNQTRRLDESSRPAAEKLAGVLFEARPGGPGELVLRVCDGGRMIDLTLDLSSGDRLALIEAAAAVPARKSQVVGAEETIRRLTSESS